jgi:hypothetical protein
MFQNWLSVYYYVTDHQKELLRDAAKAHAAERARADRKQLLEESKGISRTISATFECPDESRPECRPVA